jgi:tRNA-splicing ligase RtcB
VQQLSRIRFGTVGPSNHFIELQTVEEVLDEDAAAALGLHAGQATLQFHGGGGSLPGELGVLYGRRKRQPALPVRLQMAVQKPLHHLATARSWEELRLRRRLYFSPDYPPVLRSGAEGERLLLANAMAMNYGFAFRAAVYGWLSRLARECLGAEPELVVDSPHNSIYEEDVEGRTAVVHRHNAARIYTREDLPGHPVFGSLGQPLLLPGTNRTASYLCLPGPAARLTLRSAPHGAGATIKSFVTRGISREDGSGRLTRRFGYGGGPPIVVPHLDDRGVDAALSLLVDHDIVRPVVRLRPFAVLN